MGPKKKILAFIHSLEQEKITGSYVIDSSGVLVKQVENDTVRLSVAMSPSQSKASTSGTTTSLFNAQPTQPSHSAQTTNVSPNSFTRYGTVENTLKHHLQGKEILSAIQGTTSEEDRKCFVRIIVSELVKTHNDSCYPPKEAKIALAEAIIKEFPKFKDKKQPLGYEHYYNPKAGNDRGFIENRLLTIRKTLSPTKKKYVVNKKTQPLEQTNSNIIKGTHVIDDNMERLISALKFKLPSPKNRATIEEQMGTTRMYRRNWIMSESPSLSQIFDIYPRLLDFSGELIATDFEKLFPKATDKFITDFPSFYAPKILGYVKKYRPNLFKVSQLIEDENLRALLLLVELLPITNSIKGKGKGKGKGEKRKCGEDFNDEQENEPFKIEFPNKFLLKLLPEGTNLTEYVKRIRQKSKSSVQPYLIVVDGQSCKSSFIEGDGWIIHVNDDGNQVASFDLLFKFYYAMNLKWPESLRNFYNFVESYIYDMDVTPYNLVSSIHTNIFNFKLEMSSDTDDD